MAKLIKLWILGSAACVAAGWILSALHQLNGAGYALFFFVLTLTLAAEYKWPHWKEKRGFNPGGRIWTWWKPRRFLRPLPMLFALTAGLAALGGALHAPNNYDALTYRFPRVLHWWAASGWHWIVTPNERMNLSGTGFEWLMMPIFVATHSDRFFFLINTIAYFLLPSLVFTVFVGAGVARRVAWFWMWLLPAALCYAMQAGSISNDTLAGTYFLAAIYFAFEARRTGNVRHLWFGFLAAGLFTGIKASNLPLLLPFVWAVWPALRLVEKRFASSVVVVLLSMLVSFLPTAALNQHFTGSWTGDPNNYERIEVRKPLAGILGNGLQLGLQSLEPPFLPLARSVENWVWESFPDRLRTVLANDFPRFGVGFRELPQEESAGVGIGSTLIALTSLVAAVRWRGKRQGRLIPWARRHGLVVGLLTWIALLVYMTKLGSESTSRLIAAYYPFLLLPIVLSPAQGFLVRQAWYRTMAVCASAIALMAVFLTPSRPLWPAGCFFNWTTEIFPNNGLMAHARMVYTVYNHRNDLFVSLRENIPKSVAVIGLIEGGDDAESSLWRPFGSRRVVHVGESDHGQALGLHWLVVKNDVIADGHAEVFDRWLQRSGGALVRSESVTEKAGAGPETWSVIRFSETGK